MAKSLSFIMNVQANNKLHLVENCCGFNDGQIFRYSYVYRKDTFQKVFEKHDLKIKMEKAGLIFFETNKQKVILQVSEITIFFRSNSKKILLLGLLGGAVLKRNLFPASLKDNVLYIVPQRTTIIFENGQAYCYNPSVKRDVNLKKNNDLLDQKELKTSTLFLRNLKIMYSGNLLNPWNPVFDLAVGEGSTPSGSVLQQLQQARRLWFPPKTYSTLSGKVKLFPMPTFSVVEFINRAFEFICYDQQSGYWFPPSETKEIMERLENRDYLGDSAKTDGIRFEAGEINKASKVVLQYQSPEANKEKYYNEPPALPSTKPLERTYKYFLKKHGLSQYQVPVDRKFVKILRVFTEKQYKKSVAWRKLNRDLQKWHVDDTVARLLVSPYVDIPAWTKAISMSNHNLNLWIHGNYSLSEKEQMRAPVRVLISSVSESEFPIMALLNPREKERLFFHYVYQRGCLGFIEGPIGITQTNKAHVLSSLANGLENPLNMGRMTRHAHGIVTEAEYLVSPTTVTQSSSQSIYKDGINKIIHGQYLSQEVAAETITNVLVYKKLAPLIKEVDSLEVGNPDFLIKSHIFINKAINSDLALDPDLIVPLATLIRNTAYRVGAVTGGMHGLAAAKQGTHDITTQSVAVLMGASIGGNAYASHVLRTFDIIIKQKTPMSVLLPSTPILSDMLGQNSPLFLLWELAKSLSISMTTKS